VSAQNPQLAKKNSQSL